MAEGSETYLKQVEEVLIQLTKVLGKGKLGRVTIPSIQASNINKISSRLTSNEIPEILIAQDTYLKDMNPQQLSRSRKEFQARKNFIFNNTNECSKASAFAPNVLIIFGGDSISLNAVREAIVAGNKVIVVDTSAITNTPTFNANNTRVTNTAQFIRNSIKNEPNGEFQSVKEFSLGPKTNCVRLALSIAQFVKGGYPNEPISTQHPNNTAIRSQAI